MTKGYYLGCLNGRITESSQDLVKLMSSNLIHTWIGVISTTMKKKIYMENGFVYSGSDIINIHLTWI